MPLPLAAVAAIGGLQAVGQGLSAFGQYQSERDAARAYNRGIDRQFEYDTARYNFDVQAQKAIRAAQEQTFERNKTNIYEALGLNYNAAQRQLDNVYRSALYDEQNEAIQLAKQIGSASTRGMSGVSASRVDREPYAERGRNIAIRRQNLLEAQAQYKDETKILRNRAYSDVLRAFEPISTPLMFGPAPIRGQYQTGPNRLSLASGLINAGVSGFTTGASFFS